MVEPGNKINRFIYADIKDDYIHQLYNQVLSIPLIELHCKHIMELSPYTQNVYHASQDASSLCGRDNTIIWGVHRNGTIESERNIINQMILDDFQRPVRIVIDKQGRFWADNTHTVISWVLRKGSSCRLRDIPFYIVDLQKNTAVIISVLDSLNDSVQDIKSAIACGQRICELIDYGYRDINNVWKIKNLMIDIRIVPWTNTHEMYQELSEIPIGTRVHIIFNEKISSEKRLFCCEFISRIGMIVENL